MPTCSDIGNAVARGANVQPRHCTLIGEESVRICGGLTFCRCELEKSSHNRVVIGYLAWLILALVAAGVVLVLAAFVSTERPEVSRGFSGFRADVWAGLHDIMGRLRGRRTAADIAESKRDAPAPTSIDDFFAATEHFGEGYMHADEIGATIDRARAAVRGRTARSESIRGASPSQALPPQSSGKPPRRPSGVSGHVPAGGHPSGSERSQQMQ